MAVTFNPFHGRANEYVGLSADTKPTDVPNGSTFYEIDTKTMYMFDAENTTWYEQFQFD